MLLQHIFFLAIVRIAFGYLRDIDASLDNRMPLMRNQNNAMVTKQNLSNS